jgi:uncharacterized phiE125 gp8 family phage protein
MVSLTRITPLDGEAIIPLETIKFQAHITHAIEDATLAAFRDAAVGQVENASGFALAEAQFRWTMPRFATRIALPVRPVVSVDAITYTDAGGIDQAYTGARLLGYDVLPLASEAWPTAYGQVSVTFTAGPPPPDKLAILLAAVGIQFQILNDRGNSELREIEGMEKALASMLRTVTPVFV